MGDRTDTLRSLAETLCGREVVTDAWTAKSFTDRLFVVDVRERGELQSYVVE
jgi:hypothetical protein